VGYFGLEICVREPWSVVHFMKNAFRKGLQMVIESFAVSSSRIGYARTRWGVGWPKRQPLLTPCCVANREA